MKKDIIFHPVKGIQVAIVRSINAEEGEEWNVIVINKNDEPVTNVFVTSKGYGNSELGNDFNQKTSTLRHFFAEIGPGAHVVVEPIMPDVFHLNNEFWVSYFIGNQIYDKKFIFVPDSIIEANLIPIEPLGLQGVLHH
ncbi:hypothetical protein DYBT9623_04857 [Dyadobacter sp. CECT 9623]|jgi:hypothetical protein|uniref:Uncharacterized protein n=1 Tax=Dyadobacter linearis TaxID=2823330 RepID=A0ABM8UX42_9BACT|nr:hypothetical protein [Dyadobacter sp. CECT 9623]CAG5073671.1 hypothetical protein DYBT9623_04857 [Dyadobacter sp. CECT 9623]